MRLFLLIFLFINLCISTYSQTIKGTILDKETKNIIDYATIYFNGTFAGTSSDQNGNFELKISSENKSKPLTISCIGYQSVTLRDFSKTEPLIIYLQAQLYELEDVSIKAKSLVRKRRRYLKLLKDEFIGTTANAFGCKILNESAITFNYDSDDDTIKAYALAPIVIENKALGYIITYHLDKFEYYKESQATFFSGNIIFNEDLSEDETQPQFYKSRRKTAYLGSRMHFFRVLWSGQIKSSGFIVKNPSNKTLKLDSIVFQDENQNKFLRCTSNFSIKYDDQISIIEFVKQPVYFDESGFFNQGIIWHGEMALQRIADWLPYEYTIDQ